ncbi:RICIN domain-containing protein [Dactylosporangium sp. NPDC005555]|uniref:RICIN domain-containing protein n=1 Tax=Dactylosporangium sp. NPDC005555 TaxID=3154889 RepID=UPI0033ADCE92
MRNSKLARLFARLTLATAVAAGGVLAASAPAHATTGDWERISAVYSGLVAAVPSPWTTNGLQVETAPYGVNAWNGQWKFILVSGSTYTIENRYSHQCLDTENGNSLVSGAPVVQLPCDDTASQTWVRTRDDVLKIWRISNGFSGLALAVETGNAGGGAGFIQANNLPNNTRFQFQVW